MYEELFILESLPILPFVDVFFSSNQVLVAKIKDIDIFVVIVKNTKTKKEYYDVTWYYNGTSSPDLNNEYPFVDVLDLVKNELSEVLLFNMDLFVNKGD